MEFFISSAITIMVVLVCLVMSKIIRISDLLGSYLLGAKRTATVK